MKYASVSESPPHEVYYGFGPLVYSSWLGKYIDMGIFEKLKKNKFLFNFVFVCSIFIRL